MRTKVTITNATVGGDHVYSIRRGRTFEFLGTLVEREPHYRNGRFNGWTVRFEHDGEITYRGFAGAATVVELRRPRWGGAVMTVRTTSWREVKITDGAECVTITCTHKGANAWYGIPIGADRERPKHGPDTRDRRCVFPRPLWTEVRK